MEEQDGNNSLVKDQNKRNFTKEIREYFVLILICLAATFVLKTFVIERADVIGSSMRPTLHSKDVVLVEKLSCLVKKFHAGEIIIFNSHDEENEIYIKRVIATGGETIEIQNNGVYVNGVKLKENYLAQYTATEGGDFLYPGQKYTVPKGYVFVMGDNRENSMDSRIIGPVKVKDIEGHVVLRVFPFSSVRIF